MNPDKLDLPAILRPAEQPSVLMQEAVELSVAYLQNGITADLSLIDLAAALTRIMDRGEVETTLGVAFETWPPTVFRDIHGRPRTVGWAPNLIKRYRKVARWPRLLAAVSAMQPVLDGKRRTFASAVTAVDLAKTEGWLDQAFREEVAKRDCSTPEGIAAAAEAADELIENRLLDMSARPTSELSRLLYEASAGKRSPTFHGSLSRDVYERLLSVLEFSAKLNGDDTPPGKMSFSKQIDYLLGMAEDWKEVAEGHIRKG